MSVGEHRVLDVIHPADPGTAKQALATLMLEFVPR